MSISEAKDRQNLIFAVLTFLILAYVSTFMDVGQLGTSAKDGIVANLGFILDWVSFVTEGLTGLLIGLLLDIPPVIMMAVVVGAAVVVGDRQLTVLVTGLILMLFLLTVRDVAAVTGTGLTETISRLAVDSQFGYRNAGANSLWVASMETLGLTIASVVIALVLGLPLGVLKAKVPSVKSVLQPVLNAMQSIPPLAYLPIVLAFFGIGTTTGIVATVIFCLPPPIRLTSLGIEQVSEEVIEAARAFGSSPWQMLYKIELPLASPSIMLGVNQCLMLALSMAVLAGLAGVSGLGAFIVTAINTLAYPLAIESALAVLILALVLDNLTKSAADRLSMKSI